MGKQGAVGLRLRILATLPHYQATQNLTDACCPSEKSYWFISFDCAHTRLEGSLFLGSEREVSAHSRHFLRRRAHSS